MFDVLCRSGGILPQDHTAIRQRDQLRRERQEEYQAFLNQHNRNRTQRKDTITDSSRNDKDSVPVLRSGSSLAEKRRTLARERHQELQSNHSQRRPPYLQTPYGNVGHDGRSMWPTDDTRDDTNNHHDSRDDRYYPNLPPNRYNRQREQNIERGYHNDNDVGTQRRRWGEGRGRDEERSHRQVHFEHGYDDDVDRTYPRGGYYNDRKHWDDEEGDLMQWARGQGKSNVKNSRVSTPPSSSPPYRKPGRAGGIIDSRSLSAPVVVGGGIAALGAGISENDKRRKQKEYAEQLRAQMREKQAAKERERDYFVPRTTSMNQQRSEESQTHQRDNKSTSLRLHSENVTEDYRRRDDRRPQRRDRVHFSPERDVRHEPSHYTHESNRSLDKRGHPPPIPPYWPGMYYGGFQYPPPPSNFPFHPPPNGGIPYYPPPPSLPPSLSNPYLAPYYAPPIPQNELDSDLKRGTLKHGGLKSNLSPQRVKEESAGEEELAFMMGGSGDGGSSKVVKEVYRAQLMEQMREKRENKQRECLKINHYDQRKDQEVYDPFGKGGCGAPLRDRRGQLVTDLKHMKKVNDERMIIGLPSTTPLPGEIAEGGAAGVLENSLMDPMSPQSSYDARRSKELRTKSVQEDYKDILMNQIKEREELKRQEKEKSSEAEKLEAERIQRELKMLEEKYRREKELEKEKQRELKMKNETMKREKEEKEELERKRDEELQQQQETRLEAEKKKQALIDNMEHQLPPQNQQRSNSPPIPTLRKKTISSSPSHPNLEQPQQRSISPPVPTIRNQQMIGSNAAVRQEPSTEQHYHQPSSVIPTNPEQNTRSFSANTVLLKPVCGDKNYSNTAGGVDTMVGPSHSAHHMSRQHITSQPLVHMHPSVSDPHPSSSVNDIPPPPQRQQLTEDDTTENMLKNLRSMRQQLETERQKVTIPASDTQTSTQVNSASHVIKPDFLKPRLAAPRKNKHTPSNPSLSSVTTQQQQQQQKGEQRQRKRWQPTLSNEHHSDGLVPSEEYTGTQEHDRLMIHPSEQAMTSTRQYKTPPIWLRPRTLPDHHDDQPRAPSAGGQSQYSISTLDVERMARRNEERMQRLENILNSQARDSRTPQTILSDFLTRNSRTRDDQTTSSSRRPSITTNLADDSQNNHELDNETGYHRPVAASTPTYH